MAQERNEYGALKVKLTAEDATTVSFFADRIFFERDTGVACEQATTTFDPNGNGLSTAFCHQQENITLPELQNKAKKVQKYLRRTKGIHDQLQQSPNSQYLLNDVREKLVSLTNRALSQTSPLDETELPHVNDNLKIEMTLYKSSLQMAKLTVKSNRQFDNGS